MNFINLRKIIDFKKNYKLNIYQHLKPTLTFFLLTVSTTIYLNVDTTMLGFIRGSEAVGYYSAAVKVKQILVSVVTSLGAVLLPRLSYHHEVGNHDEFKRLTQKALNFVLLISLPVVAYFIIVSEQAILFLSGDSFLPAVLPMRFIMPTVLFIGLSNLTGIQILVPTNREKLVVYSTIIGAIVDILINSFAIPLLGATGAAIAGSIAELTVTLVQLYFLRDFIFPLLKQVRFTRLFSSLTLAVILTMLLLHNLNVSVFLNLVYSALLFFGVYGLTLLIQKEEMVVELVESVISNVKK